MNTILVLGLQVTLVAVVGIAVSLSTRKWMSSSGTLPVGATLGAVVLLTACALSPWPSWLHSGQPRVVDDRSAATSPGRMTDPGTSPYVEHLYTTPWGATFSLPDWAENLLTRSPSSSSSTPEMSKSPAGSQSSVWTWGQWLTLCAGIAMLIGLIRVVGGLWAVRLFVQASRPLKAQSLCEQVDLICAELRCTKPVELRECPQMATAATVGWRKPVVLLSDSWPTWTAEQLRSVLAHEIAHITRGDFLATVAAQVGVVLHFYHPLVHWLANRLRLEQELAADALAARVVGGSRAYLNAIGELALKQSNEPVGWPAHSFLPTRRTFLRRIEMLRDLKFLSGGASRLTKWATLASVGAVTLLAIGLRPPVGDLSAPTAEAQSPAVVPVAKDVAISPVAQTTSNSLEAKYVPADAMAVLVARPEVISAQFEKLKNEKLIPGDVPNPFEVSGLVSFSGALVVPEPMRGEPTALCMTFRDKATRDAGAAKFSPPAMITPNGESVSGWQKTKLLLAEYEVHALTQQARFFPDDVTLVIGSTSMVEKLLVSGPKSMSPLTATDAWKAALGGTVAVAVDAAGLQKMMATTPPNPFMGLFAPLWNNATQHTLAITVADKIQLSLVTDTKDAAAAQLIETTEKSLLTFATNMLNQARTSPDPDARKVVDGLLPILNGHKLTTADDQITLKLEADQAVLLAMVADPIMQARAAAQRTQQQNNLKQIVLALYNYHDVNGHFPPAVIVDPQSKVARSWRVEILPYLDQAALYEQYRKNEPWDSENNKKFLARMPRLYAHPSQPIGATNTSITAAYGRGLVFGDSDFVGTAVQEIRDGTSNTIAVLEAKTEIPWTKPEDVRIDVTQDKLPEFGFTQQGFHVALCDGSVRFLDHSTDPAMLKAMLTTTGGEIIDFNRPAAPAPVPANNPTPNSNSIR